MISLLPMAVVLIMTVLVVLAGGTVLGLLALSGCTPVLAIFARIERTARP